MATNLRCRWVRRRLALLAGDPEGRDLRWDDRRHVERHLIGCPSCRSERDTLTSAVGMLHEAGASTPVEADAPSIWPALSQQICASRHVRPNPWLGLGFGPSLGLAAGLLVAGTAIGLVEQSDPTAFRPAARAPVPLVTTPAPRPALPEGPAQTKLAAQPQVAPKPARTRRPQGRGQSRPPALRRPMKG